MKDEITHDVDFGGVEGLPDPLAKRPFRVAMDKAGAIQGYDPTKTTEQQRIDRLKEADVALRMRLLALADWWEGLPTMNSGEAGVFRKCATDLRLKVFQPEHAHTAACVDGMDWPDCLVSR